MGSKTKRTPMIDNIYSKPYSYFFREGLHTNFIVMLVFMVAPLAPLAYAETTKANFSDILDISLQIIFTLTTYSKWKFFYIALYTFPFVKKTF